MLGDIWDNETRATSIWEKVGMFFGCVAFIGIFWGLMMIGSAYEEHKLCMNGAVEHCIEADFQ